MRYPELPETLLKLEEECLEKWRQEELFQRTLEATADGEPFVFYEGPPTANGRPGLHHIISRTIKDLICRYQTMLGRSVTRIAGWDTHGLPVEIEAEAKLGISGKPEIEALGIERFNQVCRESVFTYKEEWEEFSERIGYWLDYSRPYVTFHSDYIESVWWVLKQLAEKGLLYRGHKSVPYCPRCGTALSSHEVAQGYEEIEDASLFFLCPVLGETGDPDPDGRAFLVWTTTPWTVPSNVGLAVHPYLTYVEVGHDGRRLILAEDRVQDVFGEEAEILARRTGRELVGTRYARPLDIVEAPAEVGAAWTVISEEFVSAEEGTGLVHLAPAFGADDYAAGQKHDLPMLRPVDDAGKFVEGTPVVGGMFVKDADPHLVDALEERGNLFRVGRHVHSYPHCWRCRSPLIYIARDSWFAATSSLKERMVEHNARVNWLPSEVGTGRFGEWLENNVDWALSRDRYWGTPLPVWVCDEDEEHVEWIGSLAELEERAGPLGEDFDPHRPFIDEVRWECSHCDGTMRRPPVVIDVWFDSGCMPYAQWHYPFENKEEWARQFPADFICEGLDQTRGWFYSLMAISTMLGLDPAYRNVVVNGLILDSDGLKMSKSRGNAVDPWEAIGNHGADGVRWFLMTGSNPWAAKRFEKEVVREQVRKYFDTLFNTYRFFSLYANVEEWTPGEIGSDPGSRSLLDRWILSRLSSLVKTVDEELSAYQITRAYRAVSEFLDEDLSNWYVRRSRPRFWGNADANDAQAAFQTLWEALHTVSLLISPVTPFTGDWLHRAVAGQSA
ncbi:MAG: isoleucine--tRNA ligase, partial [Gemmatimonadetes bacterium]|nr:isoleucine--tRNA ligase [Gemmatimonadota bacterium]